MRPLDTSRGGHRGRRSLRASIEAMVRSIDERMASFEFPGGFLLPPEVYGVVRLRVPDLDAVLEGRPGGATEPFDPEVGKAFLKVAASLLHVEPRALFAYVARDEISVLTEPGTCYERIDARRLTESLVGHASVRLSAGLNLHVVFASLLYLLPVEDHVVDYFVWRQEEAATAALDRYCRWIVLRNGADPSGAERIMEGLGPEEKEEILNQNGIVYQEVVPPWQRLGATAHRKAGGGVLLDTNLPAGEDFRRMVLGLLG